MADKPFTVLDLLSKELPEHIALKLKCLGGRKGLSKVISVPDLNRPGLALSGFFESFDFWSRRKRLSWKAEF